MAYGKDIADKAPPPDKLKGYKGGGDSDSEAPEEGEDDAEAAKAARVSVMQEVIDAFKDGDAAAACEALDRYNDLA